MWISLIVWLVTFLLSGGTKSGQAGKAALIATGAAAGAYYLGDAANPDSTLGSWNQSIDNWITGDDPSGSQVNPPASGTDSGGQTGSLLDTAIRTTGNVLGSWGPTGTALVAGTVAGATGSGVFGDWRLWALVAGVFILSR